MKSVLISIRPKWVEKIASGKKTIEVRKTAPKEVPFKACVYVTKDKPYLYGDMPIKEFYLDNGEYKGGECNGIKLCNGKVIGEFICDKVYNIEYLPKEYEGNPSLFPEFICNNSCLSFEQIMEYKNGKMLYGWHISDLKIYDKPKELSEFTSPRVCGNYKDLPAYIHVGCNICEYSYTINCMIKCRIDGRKPLTRPPQSYMYVEEVEQ